ncbi:MAG: hypothetical protein HGB02_08725 [Chlorobiaceae bacterium]|nr:hypothetical protein [Chlorobiaceae bacterium]
MIDFNSKTAFTDRINYLIDGPIAATAEESQRRHYLGASVVGHECERYVQFQLLAAHGLIERKRPEARNLRIFDRGHTYEAKARKWLKDAGFLFGTTRTGRSFQDFGGEYRGSVDDVVTGWREILTRNGVICPIELPALWECKCLGSKYWKQVVDKGLKEYSSTYWGQIHQYMAYLELPRCLYTVINADTMEMHHTIYNYDEVEAQLGRARVHGVITATNEGRWCQRCSGDRNFYKCKWCDFREACWST